MQSDLILPIYTDKEIMMDDISPSNVDFKCIFEKFQVDEVSIDEAEDDICFNAQVIFEDASCVGLNKLKYTEDESTMGKRIHQFMNHHWKWFSSINRLKCSKFAKFLRDLKQEMEQSDGLSNGHPRNERKFTAARIVSFQVYISSKELQTKHIFEFFVGIYTATNQTALLQVFTNKNISSNSLKIRFPEDQPTNLLVKLILTFLMLPQ